MGVRFGVFVAVFMAAAALAPGAQAPLRAPAPSAPPQLPPRDQAPPAATGTGIVRGRVTRQDNGQPLRRVLITLNNSRPGLPATLTDDNGRFELTGLPAASYTLRASKGGFVTLAYGQRRLNEPGRPIDLVNAATRDGVDLALPRGATIAGRILDEDGEPVANALVQIRRQRYIKGRRQITADMATPDRTDDRGEFRLYGIPPGTYYLSAGVTEEGALATGSQVLEMAATFYPGTSSPDAAQPVTLSVGQEIEGLSFSLIPVTRTALSVVVRTSDGRPATGVSVLLSNGTSSGSGPMNPDGSFSWRNLPPGEYTVSANLRAPEEVASARVTLAGTDVKLELTTRKGDLARGRITFDGGTAPASLRPDQFRVRPVSLDVAEGAISAGTARVRDDWTFETPVTQGARLLRPLLPDGWMLKSVRVGDADVTDTPLQFGGRDIDGIEVLVTDKLTEVSGMVRDDRGQPIADAAVVLFADDPGKWGPETRFVAVTRPDPSGRFRQRGLPPARYVAVALDYLEPGEETNPETLRRLQSIGARVALADRESKTVDLVLSNLP